MEVLVQTNLVTTPATAATLAIKAGIVQSTSMNVSWRTPAKMEELVQTPKGDTPAIAAKPAIRARTVILSYQVQELTHENV